MSRTRTAQEWAPAGFFAFRTPLLPTDELLRWTEGIPPGDVSQSRSALRSRLRELVLRPEVREALFVASPSLDDGFPLWLEKPDSERGLKAERSLVRYLQRMAARCTPFGLFAGTSVGTCGGETLLRLGGRGSCRRHTRLDMGYVSALAEALEKRPELKKSLRFHPNSSLYRAAGRLRYHESRWAGKRVLRLVGLEITDYLEATLARAAGGATVHELAAPLAGGDVTIEEAEAFIGDLIDSQVLVSDLLPTITGPEPMHEMADLLRERGLADPARQIEETRERLRGIDDAGLVYDRSRYSAIADLLGDFQVELDLARLFQVDMFKPSEGASLGGAVTEEVLRGVDVLRRLRGSQVDDPLSTFRTAFAARYGDAEVPLVEALDEEVGIGFEKSGAPAAEASPLLGGLLFLPAAQSTGAPWRPQHAIAMRKLEEALSTGRQEVELVEADIEGLGEGEPAPMADGFAVFGSLLAAGEGDVAEGRFRFHLKHCGGPSGMQMLGRFCHLDEGLCASVRDFLRKEEAHRADAAFAEVVHLPPGRVGNVIARPVLRDHEIPFLGRSSVAPELQIPVTDLTVSVRGGRVVLRSRRLGREVLPRMTNAHNVRTTGLGVYEFLASLQYQGVAGSLSWDWGPLASARFLPRVTYGRVILSLAHWTLDEKELATLAAGGPAEQFRAAQALRERRRLPRVVAVEDGDNTLPVDFENVLSVETFVHLVAKRPRALLVELPIGPEDLCARGPEGRFVHELVVPFLRVAAKAPAPPRPAAMPSAVERKATPGGPWLYAKLYCGTSTADRVLREVVRPVADRAMSTGSADHWFFIRYEDPDWHLRVRFHGASERLLGEVFPALRERAAALLADGSVHRFQLDTYDREVERYGGPEGILLCERIFHADSEAVLGIVELLSGDEGLDARWRLTLVGMEILLGDLGLDAEQRVAVLESVSAGFHREFRSDGPLAAQVSQKLRQERGVIEAMLDPRRQMDLPIAPGIALLRRRSEAIGPIVGRLRELEKGGRLQGTMVDLAPSLLHMHANRLLRSAARAQELVLYDFLARMERSKRARAGSTR